MPAPLPYYAWYARDFAMDRNVRLMPSMTARGVLRELLDAQWEDGFIDADPAIARTLIGATESEFTEFEPWFDDFFPIVENGVRKNARLESERAKAIDKVAKQRASGKKSGQMRRKKSASNNPKRTNVQQTSSNGSATVQQTPSNGRADVEPLDKNNNYLPTVGNSRPTENEKKEPPEWAPKAVEELMTIAGCRRCARTTPTSVLVDRLAREAEPLVNRHGVERFMQVVTRVVEHSMTDVRLASEHDTVNKTPASLLLDRFPRALSDLERAEAMNRMAVPVPVKREPKAGTDYRLVEGADGMLQRVDIESGQPFDPEVWEMSHAG